VKGQGTGRGKAGPGTTHAEFNARVRRLLLHARRDLVARLASDGLFFGLLPGLLAATLAATIPLPFSALAIAASAAAAGALSGILLAFLRRIDVRRLLIEADRCLGSKELVSTALELVDEPWGETFSDAVIGEAAELMARSSPRRILGTPRLPLLPFAPILVALIALALIFPFDLRSLFAARSAGLGELAMIGEDLQSYGQRLQDSARSQNLGRSLALAQDLAKLGKDLAEGSIRKDEALDRMSDLERRMAAEYDLRLRVFKSGQPGGAATVRQGRRIKRGGTDPQLAKQAKERVLTRHRRRTRGARI
jgi:hypothetical protein